MLPRRVFSYIPLWRTRPTFGRILRGGRLSDAGRLPRYLLLAFAGLGAIWVPIVGYLMTAPPVYDSTMSLILPGSGASSSVNLANIGQASTHANSAFASNAISPTETYKRLLTADRVMRDAAARLGLSGHDFGRPKVKLVDQTAFIHVAMTAADAAAVQERLQALLAAFMEEIDRLRSDEQLSRETGGLDAIRDYRDSVARTRSDIDDLRAATGLHSAAQFESRVDEVDALAQRIAVLQAEVQRAASAVAGMEARLGVKSDEAALILRLNGDQTYRALMQTMADAASVLSDAEARYGPRHPEVEAAAALHRDARRKVEARVEALAGTPMVPERADADGRGALLTDLVRQEAARAGLAAQLAALRAQHVSETAQIQTLAPLAARLDDLQRDLDVAEAVFASAIARSQSQRTDVYASYPLVQVLEDPTLPDRPSSPNLKLSLAAGIGATFMLGIALALGWLRQAIITGLTRGAGPRDDHA
ncbi:hypothetical protein GQA70_18060 [Ponticoccus alexandrii]|uniref:Polysaccharide chain length determinant N-terminal domain-containing protein n=1 Tax=Ponticoccus alexandrii TaxID=1943633 RepID=A0ABX7FEB5_9RHOB|nr:hypothetical protein GQA70_18060 [Ponticoccus alexandrii]